MTELNSVQQLSVVELAREGNFRAVAYWLNSQLVPQGIYVHVQAAHPKCLRTLVEFHRLPNRDRLVRFICHRLWQLESDLIEGVQIVARYIGTSTCLWQQSVRIPTLSERQGRRRGQSTIDVKARGTAIPPQLNAAHKWMPRPSSPQQMKLVRAFMLSGSAVAAFLMGFWIDVLTSRPSPSLPIISQQPSMPRLTVPTRPETIQAALEMVTVNRHNEVSNPNDPAVTLMFGGDVAPAGLSVRNPRDNTLTFLSELERSQAADVSMVSLSEPLADAATSLAEEYYDRTRTDSAEALKQGGVDIVSLANDQIVDYGETGLLDTIKSLDQAGIYRMGAGRDLREARRPEILDVKGQRVAYLGYSGADGIAASQRSPGINPQHHTTVSEDIKAIREEVDWIVVNYRWNQELTETVEDWQIDLARFAIDQGADLVIGQHPQVLQGAEIYKGRPIAYSLGDFLYEDAPYRDRETAVLKVSLKPEQMKVEFVPVVVKDAHPYLAEGRRGSAILDRIQKASENLEAPLQTPVVLDLNQESEPVDAPVDPDAPFIDSDTNLELDAESGSESGGLEMELETAPDTFLNSTPPQDLKLEDDSASPADLEMQLQELEELNQNLQLDRLNLQDQPDLDQQSPDEKDEKTDQPAQPPYLGDPNADIEDLKDKTVEPSQLETNQDSSLDQPSFNLEPSGPAMQLEQNHMQPVEDIESNQEVELDALNSDPVNSNPANSDPINSDPVDSDPIDSDAVNFDSADPDSVDFDSVNPDGAYPEARPSDHSGISTDAPEVETAPENTETIEPVEEPLVGPLATTDAPMVNPESVASSEPHTSDDPEAASLEAASLEAGTLETANLEETNLEATHLEADSLEATDAIDPADSIDTSNSVASVDSAASSDSPDLNSLDSAEPAAEPTRPNPADIQQLEVAVNAQLSHMDAAPVTDPKPKRPAVLTPTSNADQLAPSSQTADPAPPPVEPAVEPAPEPVSAQPAAPSSAESTPLPESEASLQGEVPVEADVQLTESLEPAEPAATGLEEFKAKEVE